MLLLRSSLMFENCFRHLRKSTATVARMMCVWFFQPPLFPWNQNLGKGLSRRQRFLFLPLLGRSADQFRDDLEPRPWSRTLPLLVLLLHTTRGRNASLCTSPRGSTSCNVTGNCFTQGRSLSLFLCQTDLPTLERTVTVPPRACV